MGDMADYTLEQGEAGDVFGRDGEDFMAQFLGYPHCSCCDHEMLPQYGGAETPWGNFCSRCLDDLHDELFRKSSLRFFIGLAVLSFRRWQRKRHENGELS